MTLRTEPGWDHPGHSGDKGSNSRDKDEEPKQKGPDGAQATAYIHMVEGCREKSGAVGTQQGGAGTCAVPVGGCHGMPGPGRQLLLETFHFPGISLIEPNHCWQSNGDVLSPRVDFV